MNVFAGRILRESFLLKRGLVGEVRLFDLRVGGLGHDEFTDEVLGLEIVGGEFEFGFFWGVCEDFVGGMEVDRFVCNFGVTEDVLVLGLLRRFHFGLGLANKRKRHVRLRLLC